MTCVRAAGCDRSNFNAADVNTLVFTLADDQNAQITMTPGSPQMNGEWSKGTQSVTYNVADRGSGLRWERVRVDGVERYVLDYRIACNLGSSPANGEYARVFQPARRAGRFLAPSISLLRV